MPTLPELEDLARRAGEILLSYYRPRPGAENGLRVQYKGAIDPVTEADHHSEAFLLAEVRSRYPAHRIIAEESGQSGGDGRADPRSPRWYIDPLDGTVNFSHGVPFFAVSIAYAEDGQVQLGVIYDPLRAECFSAERGRGAWLNGAPLRAAASPGLGRSLLVTGFPYEIRTRAENNLDHYAHFALRSLGVRRMGSAALDLAYVGAGRFDGYWESPVEAWDIAAGGLIAAEAGAHVTRLDGRPEILESPCEALAAAPALHAEMLAYFAR
jgi:myo-inositol-1(or 4)-monophosphatase